MRRNIPKPSVFGSRSLPASWHSHSSGGSAVQTFAIRISGFKRASIGGPGREASAGISEGSEEAQMGKGGDSGMEPDDLLCSRNARPRKALIGRAQLRGNPGHPLGERNERVWKED